MVATSPTRLPRVSPSSSNGGVVPLPPRASMKKKSTNHKKCKVTIQTIVLLVVGGLLLPLELAMLYRSGIIGDNDDTKTDYHYRMGNHTNSAIRAMVKYTKESRMVKEYTNEKPLESRMVQEYTNEKPLISVEARSKANPFPPSDPLILTSPFVTSITARGGGDVPIDDHGKRQTIKMVKAALSNGTVVTVGLVDLSTYLEHQKQNHPAFASALNLTMEGTYNVLRGMGVDPTLPPPKPKDNGYDAKKEKETQVPNPAEPIINWTAQLPPWGQILENYGPDPIILGLNRCQAYRDAVPPEQRKIGAAGLFSTGTNLFFTLLLFNCLPPLVEDKRSPVDDPSKFGGRKYKYKEVTIPMRKKFVQWQAPWGKHNPAEARLHYATEKSQHVNQSAVFSVVLTRHPYTWLHTMCGHSYSAHWKHDRENCDHRKQLKSPVLVRFGSNPRTEDGKPTRTRYAKGVTQLYKDWYSPYFNNVQYPSVMARFEDVVYRPEAVVRQVCDCVGGRMLKRFSYRQETVNLGPGHGHHGDSGLLPSFVKYGKLLDEYYETYSESDKEVMKFLFDDDEGFFEAMGYKLFDE